MFCGGFVLGSHNKAIQTSENVSGNICVFSTSSHSIGFVKQKLESVTSVSLSCSLCLSVHIQNVGECSQWSGEGGYRE